MQIFQSQVKNKKKFNFNIFLIIMGAINEIYWKVNSFFKELPYNVKHGVKNLIRWIPIIWKDRDYDHNFIYELIKVKLEFQGEYIKKKNRFVSSSREGERMLLVSRLIQREQDDFYSMEPFDYHESEISFNEIEGRPGLKSMDVKITSENFDEYFKKYPRIYKKVLNGEIGKLRLRDDEVENKSIIATTISYENQKRCHQLIFKIMDQNINKWWD